VGEPDQRVELRLPEAVEVAGEEAGQLAAAEEMFPRWTSRKLAEVANEVRLIRVAAFSGSTDAAFGHIDPVEQRQRKLESRDPRQPLRRYPDDLLKTPFEMTASQARPAGERVNRRPSASGADCLDGMADAGIGPDGLESRREPLHQKIDRSFRRIGFAPHFFDGRVKRPGDVLHRHRQSREMALRNVQQARCAVRVEPHANHGDAACRTQHELPRELPGKEHVRLTFLDTVRVQAVERITQMNDQLGTAVGENGLKAGPEFAGASFEGPDTLHGGSQSGGRRELPVVQGPPTLSRNVVENSA